MKTHSKLLSLAVVILISMAGLSNAVPPKVIKTIPENGAQDVDPALKLIRIEFDQDMAASGYSICGGGLKFPELIGKPRWLNKRTLVAGVRLKPNYEYEMSINCPSYQNCKNISGESAEIYPVNFKTASAAPQDPNKPSKSPAILLQEGLYAEETEGNLDKAIEIYQQVIDQAGETERIAAQATYQLGICFLKKDQKEKAAEYFQQVVSNYPAQKALVEQANQQLKKLGIAPYTQEIHFEIEPNGLMSFYMPNHIKNKGTEPITNTQFINSDFVNLTKMVDDKDRDVNFTDDHEGNIYRYNVTFNEPIMPGEEMTYTTYGTMTGLIKPVRGKEDTYRFFMNHHPGTNQPTLRIETYLLPKGAELISTTPPDMQHTEKNGRIELHVEKIIPAGGNIITEFQYKLKVNEQNQK